MSADNEKLWIVSSGQKAWVFRTRAAARQFCKDKTARSRVGTLYFIERATWGPEQ